MRARNACMVGLWLLGAACGGESQSEVSGQIVAVAPEQDALTLETEGGTEQRIRIAEDTRILSEDGAPLQMADLSIGSEITVEAADDRSLEGGLRARSIWLQDSAPEGMAPQSVEPRTPPEGEPQPTTPQSPSAPPDGPSAPPDDAPRAPESGSSPGGASR